MADIDRKLRQLDKTQRSVARFVRYWWVWTLFFVVLVAVNLLEGRRISAAFFAVMGAAYTWWLRSGRHHAQAERRIARRRARLEAARDSPTK